MDGDRLLFPELREEQLAHEAQRVGNFVLQGTNSFGRFVVREIRVRGAVQRRRSIRSGVAFDVNPYRGCSHGCVYCFARYTHGYLDDDEFFTHLYAKVNVVEGLRRDLARGANRGRPINLGSVTDPYQPIESRYRLTRQILRELHLARVPVTITTKSAQILRDSDILEEMARDVGVQVRMTITTPRKDLARVLEPYAPTPDKRFEVLARCREMGCSTVVLLMPVLPRLTDSFSDLREIYRKARDAGVSAVLVAPLRLYGPAREEFYSFLQERFPALVSTYRQLYRGSDVAPHYAEWLISVKEILSRNYGMPDSLPPLGVTVDQQSLFSGMDGTPGACP